MLQRALAVMYRRLLCTLLLSMIAACDGAREPDGEAPSLDGGRRIDGSADTLVDGAPESPLVTVPLPATGETLVVRYAAPGSAVVVQLPARLRSLLTIPDDAFDALPPGASRAERCAVFLGPAAADYLVQAGQFAGAVTSTLEYGPRDEALPALVTAALVAHGIAVGVPVVQLSWPTLGPATATVTFDDTAIARRVRAANTPTAPTVAEVDGSFLPGFVTGGLRYTEVQLPMRVATACDLVNGLARARGAVESPSAMALELVLR